MPALDKDRIVRGVAREVIWWVQTRREKFVEESHDTMSVNPFMAPLVMGMHGFDGFSEMASFMMGGHLATGHATGFGKLVDEKLLPNVFGTVKLSAKFRKQNKPYQMPVFDEIDHIVNRPGGKPSLLCLKAGRWTIQLTMAVKLNGCFKELVELRDEGKLAMDEIVLGVFYGKQSTLTDKFNIARGINTGAHHAVSDLTKHVSVVAGRQFWTWLNQGEDQTQDWVLDGILSGLDQALKVHGSLKAETGKYHNAFQRKFDAFMKKDGQVDWHGILKDISG